MSSMLKALRQIESRPIEIRSVVKPKPVGREPVEILPAVTQEPVSPPELQESQESVAIEPRVREAPRAESPRRPDEGLDPACTTTAQNILGQLEVARPVSLLFSGPDDGHGKIEALTALAGALAHLEGGRLILVDADFHRTAPAEYTSATPGVGLADVLSGRATWKEAVFPASHQGVSLIAAGVSSEDEPRRSGQLDPTPLLDELARHYRLVLVSAPAPVHPEVARMSRHCTGTYLVVELGQTLRRQARHAARQIKKSGGRLLGCLIAGPAGAIDL